MAYFHFRTLQKYTASLLDLLNDIEIQTERSDGTIFSRFVPIQYTNKEKSAIIEQLDENQIFQGNNQVLPRMSLVFDSMEPIFDRKLNKYIKINPVFNGKTYNFEFTSVPYNFNYTIVAQARGMNEASQIFEQVCSYFNPTYTMRIVELPIVGLEPTSVVIDLNSTDIEQQDFDDYSTNIVTIRFNITLRGNLYPAIKDQNIIKQIQLFIYGESSPNMEELDNVVKTTIPSLQAERINAEKSSVITIDPKLENNELKTEIRTSSSFDNKPVIKDIKYKDHYLECIYDDFDSHLTQLKFEWSINGIKAKGKTRVIKVNVTGIKSGIVECKIIDENKNSSEVFSKEIEF